MRLYAALNGLVEAKTVKCLQVGDGTPRDGRSKKTNRNLNSTDPDWPDELDR